jgi:hypothetical protein
LGEKNLDISEKSLRRWWPPCEDFWYHFLRCTMYIRLRKMSNSSFHYFSDMVGVPTIRPLDVENIIYLVGSNVTLTCDADGNPSPHSHYGNGNINSIGWTFRPGPRDSATNLTSNAGVLHLTNLQLSQRGIYTCTAFNGFSGQLFRASREVNLQIGNTLYVTFSFKFSNSSFVNLFFIC